MDRLGSAKARIGAGVQTAIILNARWKRRHSECQPQDMIRFDEIFASAGNNPGGTKR
jgi:hypothetical protein